ncbi:MAG TPA: GNAT family N-acetyltransferase [Tepidisphaeraceae bacterium]
MPRLPIEVRIATPADADAVARIYRPYVTHTALTFDETPPSPDAFAQRIRQTLERDPFLVAERDGGVVGFAYASPRGSRASFRWSIDTAVYVDESAPRTGVGTALYGRLIPVLARQGYAKAYAVITMPNAPSVGLHESLGFRHVATLPAVGFKLGAWRDVGWWELPLMPALPKSPAEPKAFAAAMMTAESL